MHTYDIMLGELLEHEYLSGSVRGKGVGSGATEGQIRYGRHISVALADKDTADSTSARGHNRQCVGSAVAAENVTTRQQSTHAELVDVFVRITHSDGTQVCYHPTRQWYLEEGALGVVEHDQRRAIRCKHKASAKHWVQWPRESDPNLLSKPVQQCSCAVIEDSEHRRGPASTGYDCNAVD